MTYFPALLEVDHTIPTIPGFLAEAEPVADEPLDLEECFLRMFADDCYLVTKLEID